MQRRHLSSLVAPISMLVMSARRDGGSVGGRGIYTQACIVYIPPDFGRIEDAAGQRRLAALLLAPPDFQTQCHSGGYRIVISYNYNTDAVNRVGYLYT